ncbi:hypothetical protein BS78_03G095700 [Paspalum vaginatum]|nr:hypothetical protein BS78_03G095700 [Paspalum vaginatum]
MHPSTPGSPAHHVSASTRVDLVAGSAHVALTLPLDAWMRSYPGPGLPHSSRRARPLTRRPCPHLFLPQIATLSIKKKKEKKDQQPQPEYLPARRSRRRCQRRRDLTARRGPRASLRPLRRANRRPRAASSPRAIGRAAAPPGVRTSAVGQSAIDALFRFCSTCWN